MVLFFFSSRRRHTRFDCDWSSDVCSSDLEVEGAAKALHYDFSGVDAPKNDQGLYGLRYVEVVVPLLKAVQEQQQMVEQLKNDKAGQSAEITALKARLDKGEALLLKA